MIKSYSSFDAYPQSLQDDLIVWYRKLILNDDAYTWIEDWAKPLHLYVDFDGEQWKSVVELFHETITVGDQQLTVAGISGVMTHPDYLGQRLAQELLTHALDYAHNSWKVDFAVLTCKHEMIPYYENQGWQSIDAAIYFDQPDGKARFDPELVVGMIYAFTDEKFPDGDMDMGLPW